MTYLGDNKIYKFGNGNRVYLGNRLIYQLFVKPDEPIVPDEPIIPDGEYQLPDVAFFFNFNAKNYVDGVIPNADGALFNEDLIFSSTNGLIFCDDHLVFESSVYYGKDYGLLGTNKNPLNRTNGQPLTIIAKVQNPTNSELHLLSNRRSDYNFMFRIYDTAWLHTSQGDKNSVPNVPLDNSQPNIVAIRCLTDGTGYGENYTTNTIGEMKEVNYGVKSNGWGLFSGYADSTGGETFINGHFYWIYVSTEQLTDEQIQQVINYNENM